MATPKVVGIWPLGIVPFEIRDQSIKSLVDAAFKEWQTTGHVRFVARVDESAYLVIASGDSNSCDAIGYRAGRPTHITLKTDSFLAVHEIGHALGLIHEHCRSDRDEYLEVIWANVPSDRRGDFEIVGDSDNQNLSYDRNSVMHYGADWGGGHQTTLRWKRSGAIHDQNGWTTLTANDRSAIQKLIPCAVAWMSTSDASAGHQGGVSLLDDGWFAQIHTSHREVRLWYSVGRLHGSEMDVGPSIAYDTGHQAKIAMNSTGKVVEIHTSHRELAIWFRVGDVRRDSKSIAWRSDNYKFGGGHQGAIALNDKGQAIEMHTSDGSLNLWYRTGWLGGPRGLEWGQPQSYGGGHQASVALNGNGVVAEMHVSQSSLGLWYRAGTFGDGTVKWTGSATHLGAGHQPSISFMGEHRLLATYSKVGQEKVVCRAGMLRGSTEPRIVWGPECDVSAGRLPAVSANDALRVLAIYNTTHATQLNWQVGTAPAI